MWSVTLLQRVQSTSKCVSVGGNVGDGKGPLLCGALLYYKEFNQLRSACGCMFSRHTAMQ